MKKIYRFKGAAFSPNKAQKYGVRIEQISDKGKITAKEIVDEAKDSNSPLHEVFEWNDTKAAERYRLFQAGNLLRNLEVEIITEKEKPRWVNAHISFRQEKGYISTIEVLSDKKLRVKWLNQALQEAEEWMERYRTYKELVDIFKAIKKTKKKIK